MEVVSALDPHVLERELLARVDAAHPRDRVAKTVILVPTTRLASHLRSRLASVRDAWLGLEVLHFRHVAREVLRSRGLPVPAVASSVLLDALARHLLDGTPDNTWSAWIGKRPGALRRLRETLVDLREAGMEPEVVELELRDGPRERDLAAVYRAYSTALDGWKAAGWTDDAGLAAAALPFATDYTRGATAVFVHGIYELVGVHLDLLRQLDRGAPVTVLLPGGVEAPAGAHAAEFARRYLGEVRPVGDPSPLAALYQEDARPEPTAPGRFLFRHVQGPAAEVKVAVREALRAAEGGTAPAEIVITARSLAPYAAALEETFDEEGLPWTTTAAAPLGREPAVRDFLLLLDVVAQDFPRRSTVELLRSPRVRWPALGAHGFVEGDLADVWSRDAKIIGGLAEWASLPARVVAASRDREPDVLERRERSASRLVQVLEALAARVDRAPHRFAVHARSFESLLDELFDGDEASGSKRALDALRELLADMARLESLVGHTESVPFERARHWLVEAVDASELPRTEQERGIRVLDAMQMRGMTCSHLHVLGLNAGVFPRAAREDPFLPDARRAALIERTGRPLPLKQRGASEERLLLALLLGTASERTVVSWQRADESGRSKTPSLALREVARIAKGSPDMDALREDAEAHVPSHPTHALEWLAKRVGLLSPADGRLLAALYGQEARLADELAARYPELTPGLELLRATQSFAVVDPAYDASVGPLSEALPLSVSAFERLGRCPLQYFFQHVLGVRTLEDAASAFDMPARELGSAVHDLLHTIYSTLEREGAFNGPASQLVERGLVLLEAERGRILGEAAETLSERLPLLWGEVVLRHSRTIEGFIREDLSRIAAAGQVPVAFERLEEREVAIGGDRQVLRAKFDRELRGPGGTVVGDYKVLRSLRGERAREGLVKRVKPAEMLKASQLQVPLYRMLAGEDATVEILGIHPELDLEADEHRVSFAGFNLAESTSFDEALGTLLGFKREGSFPFHDSKSCEWCEYSKACRRHDPSTVERNAASAAGLALARLKGKRTDSDAG